jgi:hypothetical protein
MAMTAAQWNRLQQSLPTEDRMTYADYLASLDALENVANYPGRAMWNAGIFSEVTGNLNDAANAARTAALDDNATISEIAQLEKEANFAAAEADRLVKEAEAAMPKALEVVETPETVEIKSDPTPVEKIFGPSQFSKDGRELEFKPITDGARLAIFGLNAATGKPYTDAESAAVSGGYLPEGYKNLKGYRFDPVTGALEVLGGNGTTSGLGTGYRMNAKGNILPDQNRLPKGVGIDENGKYYQPGERLPGENTAQFVARLSQLGQGVFFENGKAIQYDAGGRFYTEGQAVPQGFGQAAVVDQAAANLSTTAIPAGVDAQTRKLIQDLQNQVTGLKNQNTSTIANTTATQYNERMSVYSSLADRFNKYGLTGLANKIKELAMTGATESTITLQLMETQEYQQRFAANADRVKKGLAVLSPAEYVNVEDSYRQVLRAYGLKQFDNDAYVKQFIVNDMSPTELSNRVVTAVQRVQNADPAIINQLKQYYGIGSPDMVAYVLDPEQQFQKIERQIAASEIGVAAGRQGLTAGVSVAEQLASQGVTEAEARKGYATIADILPTAEKLSGIYGSTMDTYGQSEGEQEVFNSLASAQRKRQRLSAAETATFGASAGMNRVSLTAAKAPGQI